MHGNKDVTNGRWTEPPIGTPLGDCLAVIRGRFGSPTPDWAAYAFDGVDGLSPIEAWAKGDRRANVDRAVCAGFALLLGPSRDDRRLIGAERARRTWLRKTLGMDLVGYFGSPRMQARADWMMRKVWPHLQERAREDFAQRFEDASTLLNGLLCADEVTPLTKRALH